MNKTEQDYPHPLVTMARVLLSLPLAILWMCTILVLGCGWGAKRVDRYVELWNKLVVHDEDDDDSHDDVCGPDGCGHDDDKCFCLVMGQDLPR